MNSNFLLKLAGTTSIGLALLATPAFALELNTGVNADVNANANAAVNAALPPALNIPAASTEASPASLNHVNRLSFLMGRGVALIDMRINSLNRAEAKINASKLTADQKASLVAIIDTNITGLTALKAQIKAATDVKTERDLDKSIFTNFRIYAVIMPKIGLLTALDTQVNHAAKLTSDVFVKYQAKIDAAKAKGKDTSAWEAALVSAKAQVVDIQAKIADTTAKVSALVAANYPTTSKLVIAAARASIKANQQAFVGVRTTLNVGSKK